MAKKHKNNGSQKPVAAAVAVADPVEPIASAETTAPVETTDPAATTETVTPEETKPAVAAEGTQWQRPKVELTYKCECCGRDFISHRARQGEKLCAECIGLRRSLKGFVKGGLTDAEVIKRGKTLLGVR